MDTQRRTYVLRPPKNRDIGRLMLARSDTAGIAESLFERSELLRPPREDLVNHYVANDSVGRQMSRKIRWWTPSITGRMLFARSDTAGSIIDLSPPPRSALLSTDQENMFGRHRMKLHRWRTPPVRDGMHPPAVEEIPKYFEGSSPPIYDNARSQALKTILGSTPPVRDGMHPPAVGEIPQYLDGSSPEGTGPPIRGDGMPWTVRRKTLGSSVPI